MDANKSKIILFFGFGYTAERLYKIMKLDGWEACASSRTPNSKKTNNIKFFDFASEKRELEEHILSSDVILISIPPQGKSDPVLDNYKDVFKENLAAKWIGYLSATSVYGDYNGAWVNEGSEPMPKTSRGLNRLFVEDQWNKLGISYCLPIIRFRISGIYGPERNPFDRIRSGTQKIIQKPDHFFNRIHVDDLCEILYQSIKKPDPGEVFNVSDYTPSTSEEFINEATKLLDMPKAKKVNIRDADLSELALSFYADSKKVSNQKIVKTLKYKFKYPSYKEGLKSLIKS